MLWEIKTVEKKNVFQRTHFQMPDEGIAAGKTFYMEEWYRWGRCVVRTDIAPFENADPYHYPLCLNSFDVEDQEADDGCTLDFEFDVDDEWTEEEKAYVEEVWEKDSWMALEEAGICSVDCDTEYYGPLEIVCVDETPEPVVAKPKAAWPF